MALGEKLFSATHANLESLPEQSGSYNRILCTALK